MTPDQIARFDRGGFNAKPNCICGHPWAHHIIPGGVDNLDIYPNQRHCVDCPCRDYTEPAREDQPPDPQDEPLRPAICDPEHYPEDRQYVAAPAEPLTDQWHIEVEAEEGCFAVDLWTGDEALRLNVFDRFDEADAYRDLVATTIQQIERAQLATQQVALGEVRTLLDEAEDCGQSWSSGAWRIWFRNLQQSSLARLLGAEPGEKL